MKDFRAMMDFSRSLCVIKATSISRKAISTMVLGVCGSVALSGLIGYPLGAQSTQSPRPIIIQGPTPGDMNHPWPDPNTPTMDPATARKRLRAFNIERRKQIISDTNKLLKLARELSVETVPGDAKKLYGQDVLKAAEIEKLAHNVKEKMTFVVTGGPGDPTPSILRD